MSAPNNVGSSVAETLVEPSDWRERLYASYVSTHAGLHADPSSLGLARAAQFYQANLAPFLPPDRGSAILDVGCGYGPLLSYLRGLGYVRLHGVDLSAEQVALAHRLGLDMVKQADAVEYLSTIAQPFDLITAFDVLEHLTREELFRLLDAVYASLSPGGRLVVHTVNAASPVAGQIRYGDLTHETAYTATSISQALRAVGFQRPRVREVAIPAHGAKSALRRSLWPVLRLGLVSYLAIETGVLRGHVLSRNLVAVADK